VSRGSAADLKLPGYNLQIVRADPSSEFNLESDFGMTEAV